MSEFSKREPIDPASPPNGRDIIRLPTYRPNGKGFLML